MNLRIKKESLEFPLIVLVGVVFLGVMFLPVSV